MVALRLKTIGEDLALVGLPWERPLAEWPKELLVGLPTGLHRHVVRFLGLDDTVLALKELPQRLAEREFDILERLREEGLPAVALVGIVTDRQDEDGRPLESILVTRHLRYSLPYRFLFTEIRHEGTRDQVVDALAVLMARIHLAGLFWGDCSLNNALFRRDAGALRAYVVDTETAEWHEHLTDGQRQLDLDIGAENVLGGLLDLQAEGLLAEDVEPDRVASNLADRYAALWSELQDTDELPSGELGKIHQRLARLNDLGFDTEEYELHASDGVARFRPTVLEEGHHRRLLQRLTGIVAHENQARRLLSAIRAYGAWLSQAEGTVLPEAVAAYRWLTERWQPTMDAISPEVRDRLEDPEIYHQILEHNWYLNEQAGEEIPLADAVADYVENVLEHTADERTVLS